MVKKTANFTNASQAEAETKKKTQEYWIDGSTHFSSV